MSRFYAEGEVYNVLAERPDAPDAALHPNWWEYRVRLCRTADRATVAEWDSYYEGWNGRYRLTNLEANGSLIRIYEEVRDGKASDWFTVPAGAEKPTPGSNLQFQPDILLEPLAILEAIHIVFALEYASELEEAQEEGTADESLSPPAGCSLTGHRLGWPVSKAERPRRRLWSKEWLLGPPCRQGAWNRLSKSLKGK